MGSSGDRGGVRLKMRLRAVLALLFLVAWVSAARNGARGSGSRRTSSNCRGSSSRSSSSSGSSVGGRRSTLCRPTTTTAQTDQARPSSNSNSFGVTRRPRAKPLYQAPPPTQQTQTTQVLEDSQKVQLGQSLKKLSQKSSHYPKKQEGQQFPRLTRKVSQIQLGALQRYFLKKLLRKDSSLPRKQEEQQSALLLQRMRKTVLIQARILKLQQRSISKSRKPDS